ncbi:hypothetical protein IBX65_02625 [Candidatus Aerophobetes bacterium]|nr:hypothetical protein [Candidatus Aerophobetes bacterium]
MKNRSRVKGVTLIVCIVCALFFTSAAKGVETNLIDTPTAHVLGAGEYFLRFRFYQEGGILIKGSAGLTERLTIGASYGGVGVIGTETIKGNPEPAFSLKYKLGEEGENMPFALAVGYEGQGYGKYYYRGETITIDEVGGVLNRSFYQINSKGFYLALSKEFEELHLNIHGGVNHSLEDDPGKPGVSFFLGGEFEVTPNFSLKLEYNNGFHDKIGLKDVSDAAVDKLLRQAGGEINLGLKIQYSPHLILEIDFKDLSGRYTEAGNRTFQITYSGEF